MTKMEGSGWIWTVLEVFGRIWNSSAKQNYRKL